MTAPAIKLPTASTALVFDEQHYIGFILRHEPAEFEAINVTNKSLGLFKTENAAAATLWRCAHKQPNKRIDQ
jgi:hypothetical protein